jgi:hypothetical protein
MTRRRTRSVPSPDAPPGYSEVSPSYSIDTTLRVIVPPGKLPPATRLRSWLKLGARVFGVRVEWGAPDAPKQTTQNTKPPAEPAGDFE